VRGGRRPGRPPARAQRARSSALLAVCRANLTDARCPRVMYPRMRGFTLVISIACGGLREMQRIGPASSRDRLRNRHVSGATRDPKASRSRRTSAPSAARGCSRRMCCETSGRHARLDHVGIGAILDRQGDERGPHVVVPPVSPAERRKVLVALLHTRCISLRSAALHSARRTIDQAKCARFRDLSVVERIVSTVRLPPPTISARQRALRPAAAVRYHRLTASMNATRCGLRRCPQLIDGAHRQ